jgi:hypothetical protein
MSVQRIQSNLGALFAGISLNQWMALTPPELVQAHLNLDRQTLAALRKDQPIIVASRQQCPKRKPLPEWPEKTIAVLSTENGEVHAIPLTAPLRVGDHRILFRLKRCRESLARLRDHPKVALTIFATGNVAFTARGPARVVQEPMVGAPTFAAIAIDVENIDDHRQRELVIDSGVSLDWANERTQRFLQEHLNALREVAASEESGHDAQSNPEAIHEVARISEENLAGIVGEISRFCEMSIFERLRNKHEDKSDC